MTDPAAPANDELEMKTLPNKAQSPTLDGPAPSAAATAVNQPVVANSANAGGEVKINVRRSSLDLVDKSLNVCFDRLSYTITLPSKDKKSPSVEKSILKEVTEMFKPGRLTAIMGNSGAGKTSFLNVLAGNVDKNPLVKLDGTVKVNGAQVEPSFMKKISGFVFQDDLILSTMTVREAITMSAVLRLPNTVSREDKMNRVDDIIKILRLEKAQNTIVGDERVKGISGGERKRTSMAMEMVINPSILFLDEPTSGLDTFTAFSVVTTLKDLAEQGRTVVATIHQPSSDIFMIFDDLVLLSEGRVVYYGEASNAVSYFSKRGYECPQYMNPSDYIFMHILNNSDEIEARHKKSANEEAKETGKDRIQSLIKAWPESTENKETLALMEKENSSTGQAPKDFLKMPATFGVQFSYLAGRAMKNAIRNKMIVRGKVFQNVFTGLFLGLVYYDLPSRSFSDQNQDRPGALYFLIINMFMGSTFSILPVFSEEKKVFLREYGAGYYRLSAFFFSKLLSELPFYLILPILTTAIAYPMAKFHEGAGPFFVLTGLAILVTNTGTSLGLFFASIFGDIAVALAVVPAIMIPVLIFSGLLVNNSSLPAYVDWIKYISPGKYGFAALMLNEYQGLTLTDCNPQVRDCSGEAVLNKLGFLPISSSNLDIGSNALVLFGMFLIMVMISFYGLWRASAKF